MAETTFSLTYDGPTLAQGRMPVRDLAPALLALGDLFVVANRVINPTQPAISVELQAIAHGSFTVNMVMVQHELHVVVDLFASDRVVALANLKDLVLAPGLGLFWLVRKVRKRPITGRTPLPGGMIRLTFADGLTLECSAATLRLFDLQAIRRQTRDVVEPLAREGIESLRLRLDPSNNATELLIQSADVESFDVADEPDSEVYGEFEATVEIVSIAFNEGNKWKLRDDVGDTWWATIADHDFLAGVHSGVEAFAAGDRLRCVISVEQRQSVDQVLKTYHTVEKVLEHRTVMPPPQIYTQRD